MGEREMGRPDDRSIDPLARGPCHAYRHRGDHKVEADGHNLFPAALALK
jgi:hypothetical protein